MTNQTTKCYFLFCLLFLSVAACATVQENTGAADEQISAKQAHDAGIDIISIRLTAAGHMLDFRYKVTNPARTGSVFDRANIPYLIHEKTGARFAVPNPAKIGPMRATTRKPEVGRVYFMFFANPAGYVKKGDLVTVVIGTNKFQHLTVQ